MQYEFKENLKNLRKQKNFTQKAVAEKLGVVESCYANWEQGRTEPDIKTIIKLSQIFEVGIEEMFDFGARSEQNAGNVMLAAHSSDETRLLDIYRNLSPDMRQTLWSLLDTWAPTISHKNKV